VSAHALRVHDRTLASGDSRSLPGSSQRPPAWAAACQAVRSLALHAGVQQPLYSTEVQQRPRTVASMHCHQRLIQPAPTVTVAAAGQASTATTLRSPRRERDEHRAATDAPIAALEETRTALRVRAERAEADLDTRAEPSASHRATRPGNRRHRPAAPPSRQPATTHPPPLP